MDLLEGPRVRRDIRSENAALDPEQWEHGAGRVRVRVEESWFTVDRAFLGRHSDYFCALFQSGMKESYQDELHLKAGVRARGFLTALAVCRGEIPTITDPDELTDAVECAAFLQVARLVRYLCDIIDSDNCLLLYQAASIFGVQLLFQSAALFLCDAFYDLKEEAENTIPDELLQYSQSLSPRSYIALGTHTPSMELLQDSFRFVSYLDETEGEWKHLTHLPTLCSTSRAGVAVLDNRLYIVGGVHGYNKSTVDSSFCYDPDSGAWTVLPGPLQSRHNFTLLGHEGRLYAVGGEFQNRIISTAESYDVSRGEWTFIHHAPRPVTHAASAVARRRMFFCFWKPPQTTDIYEYEPGKDEWRLTTTLIRHQSYGHCMVAHSDNLYVMRNGPCDDFLRCLMDCYNITTGQWTALNGLYINSKGSLFTAAIRGCSAFTVKHQLTLEYAVRGDGWKPRRQMKGFPKSGSLWTCLLRLPKTGPVTPQLDSEGKEEEMALPDTSEGFVEAIPQL
ncbi:kelch repeat and BTB domain-containing protein 13 [Solea solea]|uniref:kelch repeat and BTB domain-containing protein 13 n=1 Tax=Solea solea TaxID=90069 RepID=UPI00272BBDAC|nr:kelch repeat and BTB domain-containing protein 13 [Solea solea]